MGATNRNDCFGLMGVSFLSVYGFTGLPQRLLLILTTNLPFGVDSCIDNILHHSGYVFRRYFFGSADVAIVSQ